MSHSQRVTGNTLESSAPPSGSGWVWKTQGDPPPSGCNGWTDGGGAASVRPLGDPSRTPAGTRPRSPVHREGSEPTCWSPPARSTVSGSRQRKLSHHGQRGCGEKPRPHGLPCERVGKDRQTDFASWEEMAAIMLGRLSTRDGDAGGSGVRACLQEEKLHRWGHPSFSCLHTSYPWAANHATGPEATLQIKARRFLRSQSLRSNRETVNQSSPLCKQISSYKEDRAGSRRKFLP